MRYAPRSGYTPAGGVTEGRCPGGTGFGLEQFTDFVTGATAAGKTARRELRLLIHASLDHQESEP